jgi:glycosyltransferase involved in cell wall biosynthesis
VRPGPERSADRRYRARAALADINQDLAVAEYAPVMAFAGRLIDLNALTQLLRAWRSVGQRWPSARLWLIGDGPARDALYEQIVDWELHHQVVMPGTFEDLTDVWLAADVFVSPLVHTGTHMLLTAMAAGLPAIVPDAERMHEFVDHGRTGWRVGAPDRTGWANALSFFCDRPASITEMGAAARQFVLRRFPSRTMAQQHVDLIHELQSAAVI